MPVALPTMPCARLKRPVPREMSASAKRHEDAQHGAGDAVERLHGHDHVGIAGPWPAAPRAAAARRNRSGAAAAAPSFGRADRRVGRDRRDDELRGDDAGRHERGGPLARPHRHVAADQRQHRRIGHVKEQDAGREDEERGLAKEPAEAGGTARLALHVSMPPSARTGSTSPSRIRAQREQGRNGQNGGDEEHGLRRHEIAAGTHHAGGKTVADRGRSARCGPVAGRPPHGRPDPA